jgi:hypothetical protein
MFRQRAARVNRQQGRRIAVSHEPHGNAKPASWNCDGDSEAFTG